MHLLEKIDNIKVIRHEQNSGKGAAVRTGLARVQGNYVITQDADLEYDPNDYLILVDLLLLTYLVLILFDLLPH